MEKIKRFRIYNSDTREVVGRFNTTKQVYECGVKLDQDFSYYVECLIDEIEITLDSFIYS